MSSLEIILTAANLAAVYFLISQLKTIYHEKIRLHILTYYCTFILLRCVVFNKIAE